MHEPHLSNFKPFSSTEQESLDLQKPSVQTPDASKKDHFLKSKANKKNKNKNEKIQSQMKKIGFHINFKAMDKNLFTKDVSAIIGNFFNPLIDKIVQKQRKLCQKLGYPVDQPKEQKNKTPNDKIFEESKLQNPKQNKKSQEKNIRDKHQTKIIPSKDEPQNETKNQQNQRNKKLLKRRIIRKIVKKPQNSVLKRSNEEKVLAKEMEKKFGVKLKNNRLYMKGMPKKPVSSFFFFFKDYSTKISGQNESLQTTKETTYGSALAKRISQRWKQMTEQQKQPYYEKSAVTRQAYKDSMEAFKKQNKAVFDSFKKIKRVKANETRRIKVQRDSLNLSKSQIEQEDQVEQIEQIQVQENSQSQLTDNSKIKNSQGTSNKPIDLEDNKGDLEIVIPDDNEEKKAKAARAIRNKNLRERFKSVHKPKSPAPSFFFYYNQKKAQISKQHNVTRGARITQIASVMWKALPEQEKRPYEILADERRKKYYQEMKQFELEHPEEWSKMLAYKRKVATNNLMGRRKKPVETVSEENSQENQENSESIQEQPQNQEIDSLEGKVIAKSEPKTKKQLNKSISSNQIIEEKHELSQTSIKGEEQKANFSKRKRPTLKQKQETDKKERKQKLDYKEHRPKAPISSFFMFYKMNNSLLADQFKESNGGKLVKYASEIWKNMTQTEKRPYELQSEQSRQNYYHQMEAYKEKYPEEIKQRKLELKKRQQKAAEQGQIQKKKKKSPSENPSTNNEPNIKNEVGIKCEQIEEGN